MRQLGKAPAWGTGNAENDPQYAKVFHADSVTHYFAETVSISSRAKTLFTEVIGYRDTVFTIRTLLLGIAEGYVRMKYALA
jgi:hypothetical protein